MSAPGDQNPVIKTVIQDSAHDEVEHQHEQPHDQATEVAHAWQHFHENWKFFLCFFGVVLLTVITFETNLGPHWNQAFVIITAAMRCGLIAYFMLTLFKSFSLVRNTFIFSAIFLIGMIFLSWWDSELPHIGNPIRNDNPAPYSSPSHVP